MEATQNFYAKVKEHGINVTRQPMETLQVNIGKLCNQACRHCHVESGPHKTVENMDLKAVDRLIELIDDSSIKTVDITGGAPELNPHFRYFVTELRKWNVHVIDRCNLTVFFEPGQEDTPEFLADQGVETVASLPCYSLDNVEQQRGKGVFDKSIEALQRLNRLGYGREGSGLRLSLVYNPLGASLPPAQATLKAQYKEELRKHFDIEFNDLFTITNMPIKRFLNDLVKQGKLEEYMSLLLESFNPNAAEGIMCKSLVSISWDGQIYDCDFNQMLEIPLANKKKDIWSIENLEELEKEPIAFENHCFGCTAGAGSSCTGATS